MDGFTGFKNAAVAELPEAVTVMDPFQVVRLAAQAVDDVRRRRQQELHGRRGRSRDLLHRARRVLHTGADLLTDRHKTRLQTLFAHGPSEDDHIEVEATWAIYQRMIAAYRNPDRAAGKTAMRALIDSLKAKIPATLVEAHRLGRTLTQRAADVLASFDRPGTSERPHRGDQRTPRASSWLCARVPQPDQLHRQITA